MDWLQMIGFLKITCNVERSIFTLAGNGGYKKRGLATTFKMPTSLLAMFFIRCYASFIIYFTIINNIIVNLLA